MHEFTGPIDAPADVAELTGRTVAVAERFAGAEGARAAFADRATVPGNVLSLLHRNEEAEAAITRDVRCAVARDRKAEITLHYHGTPVFEPGIARRLSVECRKIGSRSADARVRLGAPPGWEITAIEVGGQRFEVTAPDFEGTQRIEIEADVDGATHAADFAVLSPSEARGFPSLQTVAECPVCRARVESCLCSGTA